MRQQVWKFYAGVHNTLILTNLVENSQANCLRGRKSSQVQGIILIKSGIRILARQSTEIGAHVSVAMENVNYYTSQLIWNSHQTFRK